MKNIFKTLSFLVLIACMASCLMFERDNYEGPNSSVTGVIIDSLTGQPVQMEVQEGAYIQYIQRDFSETINYQNMQFFPDGRFVNKHVFSGVYDFVLMRQNFIPIDTLKNITFEKGVNNHFEIKVLPLHHIWNTDIRIAKGNNGDCDTLVAAASFNLNTSRVVDYTNPDNTFLYYTDNFAVFIDPAYYCGTFYNRFTRKVMVSWPCFTADPHVGEEGHPYNDVRREIRIPFDDAEFAASIKKGRQYYVRVGVQCWGDPNKGANPSGHSPYNYAPAVRLQF